VGGIRRLAGFRVLCVAVAAAAVLLMTAVVLPAAASASSAPVRMNYACALKSNGLMSYVRSPTECNSDEKAVTIVPGPVYVCVHSNNSVHQVASLSNCPTPENRLALTLPPRTAVYFCAAYGSGLLAYTTRPSLCKSKQFPVVVSHQRPVLAHVGSTTLQYYAGTPAVRVTSSLTVRSGYTTTLASATVKISSGLVSAEDALGFTSQHGIRGSYSAAAGVLTLTGTSSLAHYQAAL
jgi:hypothetical protein